MLLCENAAVHVDALLTEYVYASVFVCVCVVFIYLSFGGPICEIKRKWVREIVRS